VITFDEAHKIVMDSVGVLPSEQRAILDAAGMTLAEDIVSQDNIPFVANSAMDGYAVRSEDLVGASRENPVSLRVIEEVPAGRVGTQKLQRGEAVRIMTGAPVPPSADAVVMQEETEDCNESVKVMTPVHKGENVRPEGEDIRKGETVLKKGRLLAPADIGILASVGIGNVNVIKRPEVAIFATGNEIIGVEEPLEAGKVRNSNRYSLLPLMRAFGAQPIDLGIATDDAGKLREKIEQALTKDILVTTGGVSVGKYDLVRTVLEDLGMETKFWRVAMKPGKPLLFGQLKGVTVFGLPGNPVSCFVQAELFIRPAIQKMSGRQQPAPLWVEAELTARVESKGGRAAFITAHAEFRDGRFFATPTLKQGSGKLSSASSANSLIYLSMDETAAAERQTVKLILFSSWQHN
jgi:molybdopterin molybdotransferase